MNWAGIAKIGLALVVASAVGYYLEYGPRLLDAPAITASKQGEVFSPLPEPRMLPDISFSDGDGQSVKLSSFRGKVVLLNIWATWCPPCRKEMPTLDRLQAKLGGPDFEVVALSIDRGGPFVVSTFYSEIGIRALRIYVDKTSDAATGLGVTALPVTLLIDREGREIGRKIGPAEWNSPEVVTLIQGYLGAPAPDQPGQR